MIIKTIDADGYETSWKLEDGILMARNASTLNDGTFDDTGWYETDFHRGMTPGEDQLKIVELLKNMPNWV